ncbi:MAG: nodulation protein NfeD, partial [Gammaproteobacteria bacterium]|nr:nodulation protein NfeD [Gammaproteobacteria bacterium]
PIVTGRQQLVGAVAEAVTDIGETGKVFVHGENWNASSRQPILQGDKVRVIAIDGLHLEVEPL